MVNLCINFFSLIIDFDAIPTDFVQPYIKQEIPEYHFDNNDYVNEDLKVEHENGDYSEVKNFKGSDPDWHLQVTFLKNGTKSLPKFTSENLNNKWLEDRCLFGVHF